MIEDFGKFETAWCPGCGNHSILEGVKKGLDKAGLKPHQVLMVSGIGQAAKAPHYLFCNAFNGLHGRALPAATGAKLANPELTVIVESGDGCSYGEGGNHFLAALRRNPDITMLVHDNQIYGLTKGQASPTSREGMTTKAQPDGVHLRPFNPVATAVANKIGFVARGFSGEVDHLTDLLVQAMDHPGLSLVDILTPCVSFNKINTFKWYKDRVKQLGTEHDPTDWHQALKQSDKWGDEIPIGVIWKCERPTFDSHFPVLQEGPLAKRQVDMKALHKSLEKFM